MLSSSLPLLVRLAWLASLWAGPPVIVDGDSACPTPAEVTAWAGYNVVVYALAPLLYFRRRYSPTELNLRSTDRRNDLLVIVVILAIEAVVELVGLSSAIFGLSGRQVLLGAPLTFAVYLVGTVLPTMVFIQCILVPRYLRLTGSTATTVILGGVTYTLLHCFDGWLAYTTPSAVALSVIVLFLQYFGPADPTVSRMIGSVVASLAPQIVATGIADEAELDVGTLAERLALDVAEAGAVLTPPAVVGAWGRV